MAYWCDTAIEKLDLTIPLSDFPMKSDFFKGFQNPELEYPCDECATDVLKGKIVGSNVVFNLTDKTSPRVCFHEADNACIEELERICIQYKGTLIATISGEEAGTDEHIRIREGVKKIVKIVEE